MICPDCKCEYRAGVTQCADCGVSLVDSLDARAAPPLGDGSIFTIWDGNDPRDFVLVKEALDKAGIPFMGPVPTGYFILPSTRPKLEVAVSLVDRERAEKVMLELEALGDDPDELTPEEREALSLPESDSVDHDESATVPIHVSEDWDDDAPISEVWNGDEEHFANTLVACLRENGIPSHKLTENGRWRLVVRPEQELRAKEIVREVVEASPPV
jgi:hypothetical protein